MRVLLSLMAIASLGVAIPAEALAKPKSDPAQPNGVDSCATGQAKGNPCNGNNGNDKDVGNAGNRGTGTVTGPTDVSNADGDGVYIAQIGTANRSTVRQDAGTAQAFARVQQSGDRNVADVVQSGSGGQYADLLQQGDDNGASVSQAGAGQNTLYVAQNGSGNKLSSHQTASAGHNGAEVKQQGDGNTLDLVQNGAESDAKLAQNGDRNAMTLNQGNNNGVTWTQTGDGLAGSLSQPDGQQIIIRQTSGG